MIRVVECLNCGCIMPSVWIPVYCDKCGTSDICNFVQGSITEDEYQSYLSKEDSNETNESSSENI